MQPSREKRLAELRLEYGTRFRQICRDMNPDDFTELVDDMARFRQKYEHLETELARRPADGGARPNR